MRYTVYTENYRPRESHGWSSTTPSWLASENMVIRAVLSEVVYKMGYRAVLCKLFLVKECFINLWHSYAFKNIIKMIITRKVKWKKPTKYKFNFFPY